MNPETIKQERSTIWDGDKVQHLDPNCQYITENAIEKPIETYPEAHLDICDRCIEWFKRWRENMTPSPDNCDRCNEQAQGTYCDECQREIAHHKAARILQG